MPWRRWGLVGCFSTLPVNLGWEVNAKPRPLYPPENRPRTHCTGGFVGLKAGLDGCGRIAFSGIRSPDRPARSESLYGIRTFRAMPAANWMELYVVLMHKGAVVCLNIRASTSNLISVVDWGSLEVKVPQKTQTYEAPTNRVDTVLFLGTSDIMRKGGECKYRRKEINADIFKRTSILNKYIKIYV
jgi:hypothetical protein